MLAQGGRRGKCATAAAPLDERYRAGGARGGASVARPRRPRKTTKETRKGELAWSGVTAHDTRNLDHLIDSLYDSAIAVIDGCALCALLPNLCAAFGAASGGFIAHDFAVGQSTLRHGFNLPSPARAVGGELLGARRMACLCHSREGAAVAVAEAALVPCAAGGAVAPDDSGPEAGFHHLCGVVARDGSEAFLISLQRPAAERPFDDGDRSGLFDLLPHLKRCVTLHDRVVRHRLEHDSLAGMVDHIPVAFLLLGRSGCVHFLNRCAKAMVERGDGLYLTAGGFIAAATVRDTASLRKVVADAAERRECGGEGAHFALPRGADQLPLVCALFPMSRNLLDHRTRDEPAVALVIKDPQVESVHGLADFARAYGLTRAEARLIGLLGEGYGLFEAAGRLDISRNTARTHMRNIYAKVGVNRQTELVRLMERFTIF